MPPAADYFLDLAVTADLHLPAAVVEKVFALVWRLDFSAPGFCLLDLGPKVRSHSLRARMVMLQEQLSALAVDRTGGPFVCRSLGRFDQQETTRFHLDGAPAESLLVLGYEPSRVQSRLYLADYSRCAFDLGMEPLQFLNDFNPMIGKGEAALRRYVTELPQPAEGHARILLLNNSSLPITEDRRNPLGVLHRAEILTPSETEHRIVNSMMLVHGPGTEPVGRRQLQEFVDSDQISPKIYGH
jgi:hypothetical protein